jgi:hypothetical protein
VLNIDVCPVDGAALSAAPRLKQSNLT